MSHLCYISPVLHSTGVPYLSSLFVSPVPYFTGPASPLTGLFHISLALILTCPMSYPPHMFLVLLPWLIRPLSHRSRIPPVLIVQYFMGHMLHLSCISLVLLLTSPMRLYLDCPKLSLVLQHTCLTSHLSHKVITAQSVLVPGRHYHRQVVVGRIWWQQELQGLMPLWKPCLLLILCAQVMKYMNVWTPITYLSKSVTTSLPSPPPPHPHPPPPPSKLHESKKLQSTVKTYIHTAFHKINCGIWTVSHFFLSHSTLAFNF